VVEKVASDQTTASGEIFATRTGEGRAAPWMSSTAPKLQAARSAVGRWAGMKASRASVAVTNGSVVVRLISSVSLHLQCKL
jgi:hypothetical protein